MREHCGAVYGVSGLPWLAETLVSAASLKLNMPDLPRELFIEKDTYEQLSQNNWLDSLFDFVNVYEEHAHWRSSKFKAFTSQRFEKNLFLDGDTWITSELWELFDLLDHFDIAAMPAPQRIHRLSVESGAVELFPTVPLSFPEYNTGVIPFKKSDAFSAMLKHWQSLYEKALVEKNYMMDQASFRSSIYHSNLRLSALMPEYNFRAGVPNVVKGRVKIVHAHGHLKKIAEQVNSRKKMRVWKKSEDHTLSFKPKGAKNVYSTKEEELKEQLNQCQHSMDFIKSEVFKVSEA